MKDHIKEARPKFGETSTINRLERGTKDQDTNKDKSTGLEKTEEIVNRRDDNIGTVTTKTDLYKPE
jgi:hypothetical protein